MKSYLLPLFIFASLSAFSQRVLTLEACYELAEKTYPLAKQRVLLEERSIMEVGVINKERLPKIDLNAQATYQSDVIHFPIALPNISIASPNQDQYRATLDANQLIYHGGSVDANIKLKEAELQTQQQQVEVTLYALRARINQNYFRVLFHQEQAKLLTSKMHELETRLKEIEAGVKHGAILPSAQQALRAESLKLEQQLSGINYDRKKALASLSALVSKDIDNNTILQRPNTNILSETNSERPELKLFDLQQSQLEITKEVISKSNSPQLIGFGQVGYGNPGLNMLDNSFQDFYMVGLKMKWNVLDWGTSKEKKQMVAISKEILTSEKETFVLNNAIQLEEAKSDIAKFTEMLQTDDEIIQLREQVLKATTSQFKNGSIPSSAYITELNNLYEAKITQEIHKTQLSLARANYKLIIGNL